MTLTKLAARAGVDTPMEFEDAAGRDAQGVVVVDENGEQRPIRAFLDPEHLTLTTTDETAVQDNFDTLDEDTVRDVMIQNLTEYDAYVIWGTDTVTATSSHTLLRASSSISLEKVKYTYFSVIRAGDDDVSVRITGIG
jgi:hypothetical protein